jgi:predicted Zn-dependent peptidase
MVFGRHLPTEEVVANIEAVDRDAILNAAQRIFSSPLTIAALGPISKLESFEKIVQRLE